MNERLQFLRDRLDETEEALRSAPNDRRLYVDPSGRLELNDPQEKWADGEDRLPNNHAYWSLAFDPAQALAWVQAHRELLDFVETPEGDLVQFAIIDPMLRVYQAHEDFQPQWLTD